VNCVDPLTQLEPAEWVKSENTLKSTEETEPINWMEPAEGIGSCAEQAKTKEPGSWKEPVEMKELQDRFVCLVSRVKAGVFSGYGSMAGRW